jgi:hypothetical protein
MSNTFGTPQPVDYAEVIVQIRPLMKDLEAALSEHKIELARERSLALKVLATALYWNLTDAHFPAA